MAHALLKFDLSDPDDAREHRYALAGRAALIALELIDQRCRSLLKHGSPTAEQRELAAEIRQLIRDECAQALES
jgi:hypothetical protein